MQEVELDKHALRSIFDTAHRMYLDKSGREFVTHENFLCYCISMSFISYAASKNWVIKNGKIYESAAEEGKGKK